MQAQDLHASKGKRLALVEDSGTKDLFGGVPQQLQLPLHRLALALFASTLPTLHSWLEGSRHF
jgi:hypothetical protein